MLRAEMVWPQFAMQIFGDADSTPGWGEWEVVGEPNHTTLFAYSDM